MFSAIELDNIMDGSCYAMTNGIHLRENVFYYWFGSLASGGYLTAFINCCLNKVAHTYSFNVACKRASVPFEEYHFKFFILIYLVVLGDDSAFNVKDYFFSNGVSLRELFNELTLAPLS